MTTQSSKNIAMELTEHLLDTRTRELEILSDLNREQLLGAQDRTIEPPIWELGHVGWFQEFWILRNLYNVETINPKADKLYDSFNIPNAERWDLAFPSRQETVAYITDVLDRCLQRLDRRSLTPKEVYFYRLAINHEDMHSETLVHIRQTLGYPRPQISNTRRRPPQVVADYEPHDVEIPGGTFLLGATPDMPFVLDNEKWAHPV